MTVHYKNVEFSTDFFLTISNDNVILLIWTVTAKTVSFRKLA